MPAPTVDIRLNFDGLGLNRIDNDGFETNTTGWSVSAGIQGAGSSITRNTSGGAWEGTARGRLVTTATSGSGVKFVMSSSFASGVPYRFSVYLKSVSGATTCGIRIGSLGTAGDRQVSTFTVTATWTRYTVDFTPSANRTDIQVNVYTTSAAAMTVDIDAAEVYTVADDITAYCDELSFDHGANFEGGLMSGAATLHLMNLSASYPTDIVGGRFTQLAGSMLIGYDMAVYIRATYAGVPYGLFYGKVRKVTADPTSLTVTVTVADPIDAWSRAAEVNIATSTTRSIATFRGLILDAIGEPAARRNLTLGENEGNIPVTGADQADALNLLNSLDTSTATLSYLAFDPSTSVLFKYTTLARNASVFQAPVDAIGASASTPETGPTDFIDYVWEVDEVSNTTDVRVDYTTRSPQPTAVLWTSPDVPFTVNASSTRTDWATFSDPAINLTESHSSANLTVTLTPFMSSAKIDFTTAGAPGTITAFTVSGQALTATNRSVTFVSGGTPVVVHPPITAEFVPSTAAATALAEWIVLATAGGGFDVYPHLTGTVENLFPTQVARRVTDAVDIITARTGTSSGPEHLIRSIQTTIDMGAANWTTTYGLQRYSHDVNLLVLDTGHLDLADGTLGL